MTMGLPLRLLAAVALGGAGREGFCGGRAAARAGLDAMAGAWLGAATLVGAEDGSEGAGVLANGAGAGVDDVVRAAGGDCCPSELLSSRPVATTPAVPTTMAHQRMREPGEEGGSVAAAEADSGSRSEVVL